MLVKFRSYPIGLTADIEKAFHQILITLDDKDMLRFLWWDDISCDNLRITQYRFCCLVFGLIPSPAILNGVLQHHLASQQMVSPNNYSKIVVRIIVH